MATTFDIDHRKASALLVLESDIRHKLGDQCFFYPPERTLGGFYAQGSLFFLSISPSKSRWLHFDPSRRLLYQTMFDNGVQDCPISDCIKERPPAKGQPPIAPLKWHVEILKRELEIRRVEGIVAIGLQAEEFLYDHRFADTYWIMGIPHFAKFRHARSQEEIIADQRAFRERFALAVAAWRAPR